LPWLRRLAPFPLDFAAGAEPQILRLTEPDLRIVPLICFEDTMPDYTRRAARQEADLGEPDLLVNLTNDGWFPDSPGAEMHFINAKFRTVELDMPLLRAANTGVTAVVSQVGRVESVLEVDGRRVGVAGVLSHELRWWPSEQTPYERWGNWIVLASALFCLGPCVGRARGWLAGRDTRR
jgi:apolipoprotein N-acyltransferase